MKKLVTISILFFFSLFVSGQEAKDFYKNAKKSFKSGDYKSTISNTSKAIDLDKEFMDAYLLRGEAYFELKDYKSASEDLVKASLDNKRKKDVQMLTGKALFNIEKYSEAIPHFETVIDIDDDDVEGYTNLYQAAFYSRDYIKAKKHNEKAISEDEENATHYFFQGLIAEGAGDMALAEKGLVDCAKRKNDYAKVYTELARIRNKKQLYSKASVTADVAIKNDKNDNQAYYIKAFAQEKQGDFSSAAITMSDLINIGADDKEYAYFMRGSYYLGAEDLENAKKDFTYSIKENPESIKALDKRALIYEKMDDIVLASNDYKAITKINPADDFEKKIIDNANYRIYELNKEKDVPEITLISHSADEKGFVSVRSNQPNQEFKLQLKDASKIKSVTINEKSIDFDKENLNPLVKFETNVTNIEQLRVEVTDEYLNKAARNYFIKLKKISPPQIALNEPYASTNGETYIDKDVTDLFVEGKITHSEKVKSITVNGIPASFLEEKMNPVFSAKINVKDLTSFEIDVEGEFGTRTAKKYTLVRTEVSEDNPMGKTWVVFIENSNYQNFSSLEGPTKDINLIKSSLGGYEINKVIHKKDMSKADLDRFFSIELRDMVKKGRVNSLMVWYAGHGKFVNETGYWIPTDAKRDEEYSYYNINALRASMQSYDKILVHNLVITDACESGPSFYLAMRDTPKERVCGDWEATKFRSAQVLSSAGYELAADNSQFTKTFASMLQHNPDNCIPIEKISNKVVEAVSQTGNQKPSLGKIKGLQDQNGTFFFIKK